MPKTKELVLADDLSMPVDAVTQSLAWLAATGAGKSNAVTVFAEQMYGHGLPWVLIDPKGDSWGIRSAAAGTGPGLPVPIFGGLHGDVPLEPEAGGLLADLVVDQNLTCILDVSELPSKAAQVRFLTAFAERIFRLQAKVRQPRHLILEEADEIVPQRVMHDMARCVGAWTRIVKQGRQRGLGCSLVSQRSAVVNKDALTQCGTLVALRTTSPQDRKAVLDWVNYHAVARELVDSLPGLENGDAWIVSPQFLHRIERVHFHQRRTFDSGATPLVGESRPVATLADIDLGALEAQMAGVVVRAEQDDPKALRRRIADLERRLATAPAPEPIAREVRVEVPVAPPGLPRLRSALAEAIAALDEVTVAAEPGAAPPAVTLEPETGRPAQRMPAVVRARRSPAPGGDAPASRPGPELLGLGKAERAILSVLAQFPAGRTKRQLAMLTGYSAKGGGFANALGRLRSSGLVVRGEPITVTDAGLERIAGQYEQLPSGPALLEHWCRQLGKAERLILSELVTAWPDALAKEELAARTGYAPTGGGFANALGRLRTLQLVDGRGELRADETLAREVRLLE